MRTRQEEKIEFVREQDGVHERQLKVALSELFVQCPRIERGYLVVVRYGPASQADVALALVAGASHRQVLVEAVQTVFASQFRIGQHLDIIFPSLEQESAIALCCRPFFDRRATLLP
jgi:hypothetical protein